MHYDRRIFVSVIFFNLTFSLFIKNDYKKIFYLFFWSVLIPFFSTIGSDIFVDNFFASGTIILLMPISFLTLSKLKIRTADGFLSFKVISIIDYFCHHDRLLQAVEICQQGYSND